MPTNNTYEPRLYKISQKIHEVKNDRDSFNEAMTIHNSLLPFYKQLSGDLTYDKEEPFPYMPIIDLDTVSDDNLEKLCTFYLDYMRNPDAGPNVRKVKSNLTKIRLSADTELADQTMLLAEKYCNVTIDHENNNVDKYNEYYSFYQQSVRSYIEISSKMYLVDLKNKKDKNILKKYFIFRYLAFEKIWESTELEELQAPFNIWYSPYRSFLYIDISLWIILQAVTHCIIWNKEVSCAMEYLNQLCEKVESLKTNRNIKNVACAENIFTTYSEFLLFPSFKSRLMEDILVLKQLQDCCSDNEPPKEEYSLITDSGEIKKLTNAQRCHIFLEGDDKGKRAFNDNLKKCHEFIDLYNSVTTRHLQHDEITLKAVYRELVLEKTKRNEKERQGITILNDFIRNGKFRSKAEYYFINEKINFGMYRERGAVKEFFAKNELQEKLYELATLLLTLLEPMEIFQEAQKDYSQIFSLLTSLIPEPGGSISYKEIETSFSAIRLILSDITKSPLI